ncbi:rac GTPase-activating protein 1-like [Trichogramma pretiosum]|uniref:rac GTPase-activating protein 1-like n=1 Tax=Trichogramma pretiosum TaxID=7493 RepID=UPI0006C9B21A|nr:rac GTPase-activating protein 1-like [Trichogramma pretiosum]
MSTPPALSILAAHDELTRCSNVLVNGSCEGEFLQFVINQEEIRQKWLTSVQECQRLHNALDKAHQEAADLDRKLCHARRLLDDEKKKRKIAEDERLASDRHMMLIRDILFMNGGRVINDDTREQIQHLINGTLSKGRKSSGKEHTNGLNTIAELDSTGTLLSDLSHFSKSEDDLDASIILQEKHKRNWKDHRPSGEHKRRRSIKRTAELNTSDCVVAKTRVVVPKDGPVTATTTIEAVPTDNKENSQSRNSSNNKKLRRSDGGRKSRTSLTDDCLPTPSAPQAEIISTNSDSDNVFKPSPNINGYTFGAKTTRAHVFISKKVIRPEVCSPCGKRIGFGKCVVKCRDCRALAHTQCRDLVPLPCVPTGNTPTLRGATGTIADYTPMVSPMVPSLVVHCINEVELRGMSEQGLYRISGSVADVKALKEKFLKGRGAPNLSEVDIPTICSTLKDFLRSLKEPLITVGLWSDFVKAAAIRDPQDAETAMFQAVSELPQPNRDTLAFLILHLQRVSSTPECKMPIGNLARVFGPTLVGYSCSQPSNNTMLSETKNQSAVVECLLRMSSDYWAHFINSDQNNEIGTPQIGDLRRTTSAESLAKRGFFNTPISSSKLFSKKNKKYFATPPSKLY